MFCYMFSNRHRIYIILLIHVNKKKFTLAIYHWSITVMYIREMAYVSHIDIVQMEFSKQVITILHRDKIHNFAMKSEKIFHICLWKKYALLQYAVLMRSKFRNVQHICIFPHLKYTYSNTHFWNIHCTPI